MNLVRPRFGALAMLAVILLQSGCTSSQPAKVQMSVLSIKAGGRIVNATVPAPSFIQQEGDNIVVVSGKHRIVIERERVMLDGEELVKVPAETANIQMWISETGLLTMNRDGMALATKQL